MRAKHGVELSMNRVAANVSSLIFGGDQSRLTSAATRRGSWSQCVRKRERGLSMNRKVACHSVRFLFVVGEATDEPAREDARPTNPFMAPLRVQCWRSQFL
jgi:hypothetical protein